MYGGIAALIFSLVWLFCRYYNSHILHCDSGNPSSRTSPWLHLRCVLVWRKGILAELSLCYSVVYDCYGGQCYEQFLQFVRLDQALILLSLALCLLNASLYLVFMVLYIHFL